MIRPALAAFAFFAAGALAAALGPRQEVEAVLERLAQSGCRFHRNGEWYDAQKARAHLEDKLAYLERWSTLESAEQFIEKAASGSSVSGQPYLVQCGESEPVPSAEWLRAQLKALRAR
jgi:hypothetical protein